MQFRCTARASLFCFLGYGYAYRHMASVLYFHRVKHVSVVQKWQKQQIQLQKTWRLFPLYWRTWVTQSVSVYAKSKGKCHSTQLDWAVILKHLPAALEKDTLQQPKDTRQCWYPLNSFLLTSETDIIFHRGLPTTRASYCALSHKSRKG